MIKYYLGILITSLMYSSDSTDIEQHKKIVRNSNITLNLSDTNSINLTSATTDPGDGIRSVKELNLILCVTSCGILTPFLQHQRPPPARKHRYCSGIDSVQIVRQRPKSRHMTGTRDIESLATAEPSVATCANFPNNKTYGAPRSA